MSSTELATPSFDWETASRRDGMVRFGPIIGHDLLQINEIYQQKYRQAAIDQAIDDLNEPSHDSNPTALAYQFPALASACFKQAGKIIDNEGLELAFGLGVSTDMKASNFAKWFNRHGHILFLDYDETLLNSFGGMFSAVHYALELLDATKAVPKANEDLSTALTTTRQAWLPEFMRQMADAAQLYWGIPDAGPSSYNPDTIFNRVDSFIRHQNANGTGGPKLVVSTEDSYEFTDPARYSIGKSKKQLIDSLTPRSDEFDPWTRKTSSGCPVRHKRIGSTAIEQTFNPDQLAKLEELGVIKQTEAGYELFDFMKFAADFVADHLEELNTRLMRAEVVPEVI